MEKAEQYQYQIWVMHFAFGMDRTCVNELSMKLQGIGDMFSDVKAFTVKLNVPHKPISVKTLALISTLQNGFKIFHLTRLLLDAERQVHWHC
jgi:hypothetical protein